MKLLSHDSSFSHIMSVVADLIIFNLLALLLSLPVVTAGAAMTALYALMGRLVRGEAYSVKYFFAVFRQNFAQATLAWLLLAVPAFALMAAFVLAGAFGGTVTLIVSAAVYIMGGVWLITYSWTFPLLSQFENRTGSTIVNALRLGLAHLPRSIVMGLINLFPWGLLYLHAGYFFYLAPLWLVIYFSGAAFLGSLLIKKPLTPYRGEGADGGGQGA
ncbi:MAG: DUF624 domain-containing protein [Clostridia bacterium]|nr:DUF624 domain-containing protein [Clostridia bacterium]